MSDEPTIGPKTRQLLESSGWYQLEIHQSGSDIVCDLIDRTTNSDIAGARGATCSEALRSLEEILT